jgi:hypothetical protein
MADISGYEIFTTITYTKAKEELKGLYNGAHKHVKVCTIDYNNNIDKVRLADLKQIDKILKDSKTIILDKDELFHHIMCFSERQNPKKLIGKGIQYDIIY